ncbi:GNAT family N-acetyltransferase [Novosphingobium sp.]|uniref:GNAT family N-acetyltransferase n=1 Tax=Novosphingobium sp. TaxID=1874826 RepID=UPI00352A67DA
MGRHDITALRFVEDTLSGEEVQALVAYHLADMQRHSPADKVHALPVTALRRPDVTFWSAWIGEAIAGICALRHLADDHGELKSMRAAPEWRGHGVGEAMLVHLLAEARRRGYARVSLETGRTEPFHPAVGLYRKHGFVPCPAFADYVIDDFSQCLTLDLSGRA